MAVIHDVLYLIFYLFYIPILLVKGKWHRGLLSRFGNFTEDALVQLGRKPNIWFHAVSVGEVQAILGLISRFHESFAQYQPVLTTVTKTGYHLAKTRLPLSVVVLYAPLDFSWVVRKYVRTINPRLYITAETEVWPNLFAELAKRKVPNLLVNGRISDGSFSRYRMLKGIFKNIFGTFSHCCVQTSKDADRLMQLGVSSANITLAGNMKFDDFKESADDSSLSSALSEGHKIWIAGSTHPQEEDVVLKIYNDLRQEFKDLRLIIAPRHIERTNEIKRLIEDYQLNPVLFSQRPQRPLKGTDVVIVDTIGHLRLLYRYASVVFVGKSLKGKGGQNIIEPAFYAKPIIVGPHMGNFLKIVEIFKGADAIIQISDEAGLKNAIADILRFPLRGESLGLAAYNIILSQQGATTKTLERIAKLLSPKAL